THRATKRAWPTYREAVALARTLVPERFPERVPDGNPRRRNVACGGAVLGDGQRPPTLRERLVRAGRMAAICAAGRDRRSRPGRRRLGERRSLRSVHCRRAVSMAPLAATCCPRN